MAEYLTPGVYIEEKPGPKPIQGVGTAMAAFLGFAPSGPANVPLLVTSWTQYKETFGVLREGGRRDPHLEGAYLSHSVYGYFLNGGSRCYVTRLVQQNNNGFKHKPKQERIGLAITDGTVIKDEASKPHLLISPLSDEYYGEITVTVEPQKKLKKPVEFYGFSAPKPVSASSPSARSPKSADGAKADPSAPATDAAADRPPAVQETTRATALSVDDEVKRTQWFTLKVNTVWGTVPSSGAGRGEIESKVIRQEEYVDLSLRRGFRLVEDIIKQESKLIRVNVVTPSDANLLDGNKLEIKGTTTYLCLPQVKANPSNVLADKGDFEGDAERRTGIDGLEVAEDVTMVCCPDLMAALKQDPSRLNMVIDIQNKIIAHCEKFKRMAVLDAPPGLTPQKVLEYREKTANFDSAYAALYYPWVKIMDDDGYEIEIPPSGHIAGLWGRSDSERGVHKAPANEVLRGPIGLAREVTSGEQAILNPAGINCIRAFPGRGLRVWGARTLSSDAAWRYVNVRRLFNYVEKSIERGTQWVVFEPNNPNLWSRVSRDISAFLRGVWLSGALFGNSDAEAFFVKCDAELNPSNLRDEGKLIIEIGLAPVKPAEFVIIRFSQIAQ